MADLNRDIISWSCQSLMKFKIFFTKGSRQQVGQATNTTYIPWLAHIRRGSSRRINSDLAKIKGTENLRGFSFFF